MRELDVQRLSAGEGYGARVMRSVLLDSPQADLEDVEHVGLVAIRPSSPSPEELEAQE
jgi:hypothetical protein